jgi:CRP-like cAMP-binding protein
MAARKLVKGPKPFPEFDLKDFGIRRCLPHSREIPQIRGHLLAEGDPAAQVMYSFRAASSCPVLSKTGKGSDRGDAEPGDFFGEGCLAGQSRRMASATAVSAATVLVVERRT